MGEALAYSDDQYYDSGYSSGMMQGLPNPMIGSQSVNQNGDFMRWLFSFRKEVVEPLKWSWRGYEYDSQKRTWIQRKVRVIDKETGKYLLDSNGREVLVPVNKPLMNEKGIVWAISLIESYINPVFIVSNYDERYMNYSIKTCMRNVIKNLYYRYKEFGLHKLDIERVRMEIETKIQAIFLGARGDGFRKFFSQQHHTQESIVHQQPMQQPGILAGITSIFKKNQGAQG